MAGTYTEILDLASQQLQSLSGHVFDLLTNAMCKFLLRKKRLMNDPQQSCKS
jgi:hypothetical protein